jgi:hypothetical protein
MKVILTNNNMVALMGGAIATMVDENQINMFRNKLTRKEFKKERKMYMEMLNSMDEKVVIIHNALKDKMSRRELEAVVAHEEGHVVCGHFNNIEDKEVIEINGSKILDNIQYELEADAYAVSKTSKTAVRNGLRKAIMFALESQGHGHLYSDVRRSDEMRERFNALK